MNKVEIIRSIKNDLKANGFAHLAGSKVGIINICKSFGEIILKKDIKVDRRKKRLYNFPDKIPFHSDHPLAKIVIWKCIQNEKSNKGAINLIDVKSILENFDDFKIFTEIYLNVPNFYDMPFEKVTPLLKFYKGSQRIFYAERLKTDFLSIKHKRAFLNLGKAIKKAQPYSIKMNKNDILIVDNHRMLHGRGKISLHSKRHLVRYWIKHNEPTKIA